MIPFALLPGISLGPDFVSAVGDSDAIGLICLVALLYLSLRSGFFMFSKSWEVRLARAESEDFISECREGHKSLEEIYKLSKEFPGSPIASLFRETYIEYEMDFRDDATSRLPLDKRIELSRHTVESALERTIAAEMRRLENRLIHLATTSTLAPFVGLLGTVCGVLSAFQALGESGHADLTTLAPGISTALITTVFGLIVAIPSVWVYNRLAAHIAQLSSQMDSFGHEMTSVFQKNFLQRGARLV